MKYAGLVILLLLVVSVGAYGQYQQIGVSYSVGFPMSPTKDYVNKVSWRGFGFEVRYHTNENMSFGGYIGWNIFSEKVSDPINLEGTGYGGTVSGTQVREANYVPIFVNAHYYFGDRRQSIRPYVGLNLGTIADASRLFIGVYEISSHPWHFALAPEVGILVPFEGTNASLVVNGKYNYGFKSGTGLAANESNAASYVSVNVGFLWTAFR